MWNMIACNKVSQQKSRQKLYQLHRQKISKIKSTIKIVSPHTPNFMIVKPKNELNRRQRMMEIDRENQILLHKMDQVYKDKNTQFHLQPQSNRLKSLNEQVDNLHKANIEADNKKICDRLMRVSSHYSTRNILSDTQKLVKIKINISENARRLSRSRASLAQRPFSTYSKFIRSGQQNTPDAITKVSSRMISRQTRPGSAPSVRNLRSSFKPKQSFMTPVVIQNELTGSSVEKLI